MEKHPNYYANIQWSVTVYREYFYLKGLSATGSWANMICYYKNCIDSGEYFQSKVAEVVKEVERLDTELLGVKEAAFNKAKDEHQLVLQKLFSK